MLMSWRHPPLSISKHATQHIALLRLLRQHDTRLISSINSQKGINQFTEAHFMKQKIYGKDNIVWRLTFKREALWLQSELQFHTSWLALWLIVPRKCFTSHTELHKWVVFNREFTDHYSDVIMSTMAYQNTGVSIVCSTVCSGTYQWKHQSPASLAFVRGNHRWPVDSHRKRPVTRKMFPFDNVIM